MRIAKGVEGERRSAWVAKSLRLACWDCCCWERRPDWPLGTVGVVELAGAAVAVAGLVLPVVGWVGWTC